MAPSDESLSKDQSFEQEIPNLILDDNDSNEKESEKSP